MQIFRHPSMNERRMLALIPNTVFVFPPSHSPLSLSLLGQDIHWRPSTLSFQPLHATIKSLLDFTICSPVSYRPQAASLGQNALACQNTEGGTEKELSCSILSNYAVSGSSICLAGPGFRGYFRRNIRANSLASFESSSRRIIRQVAKDRMGSQSGRTTTSSGGSSKALG
jgi:hypothetical protein